ncbi:hypothetical protein CgunFtcFv8_005116 [Champsocephalus gunnari]|uniref:Ig-like domain-containing protein n=1 Tax=Champsocephalus gunnari TaxID=52237 RepID=A0AAN8HCE7_CHAGU|nr:hypothetical protein CgunFtcFv8_005116 [Champsocephalus gunnari]
MTELSTIYKLSLVTFICFIKACSSSCPVLECWFVQEKTGRGGGLTGATSQDKSLLHIRTDAHSHTAKSQQAPSDINPDRVYFITDPAATLCHHSLNPPRGSVEKPECEINPFSPQPSDLKWVAPLTDSGLSPIYLEADWFSTSMQGLNKQVAISTIMRAPTATKEHNVILSVTSNTVSVQSRLGEPVLLDCGFWVTLELEIVEPPSVSIYPSPLPLAVQGQTLTAQCEASGFAPLSLELSWEFQGTDGKSRPLGSGSVTGHRQAWDGTYSQSSRLELDTTKLDLGRGGEVICVAVHLGGKRQASVTLNVIGFSTPSIEDSMGMVGVALVLYGLIKFVSWTFTSSGSDVAGQQEKKDK